MSLYLASLYTPILSHQNSTRQTKSSATYDARRPQNELNERAGERGRGRSQRSIVLSAGRPHAASVLQGVKKDARNQEDCKSQLRLLNGRQQRRQDKQDKGRATG